MLSSRRRRELEICVDLVEPERGVVGHRRLVWRRVRVVILADDVVGTPSRPSMSRAIQAVAAGSDRSCAAAKASALILTKNHAECPPDVAEDRLVGVMVKIVVDGRLELVVLGPRRDGFARAGTRHIVVLIVICVRHSISLLYLVTQLANPEIRILGAHRGCRVFHHRR